MPKLLDLLLKLFVQKFFLNSNCVHNLLCMTYLPYDNNFVFVIISRPTLNYIKLYL